MRYQTLKLRTSKSTKAERVFFEILKGNRIPFKAKVKILGKEIDFLVGKFAIEINGHEQCLDKNNELIKSGYVPVHFSNYEIINHRQIINKKLLCLLEQI
jgi:hypothetical protein